MGFAGERPEWVHRARTRRTGVGEGHSMGRARGANLLFPEVQAIAAQTGLWVDHHSAERHRLGAAQSVVYNTQRTRRVVVVPVSHEGDDDLATLAGCQVRRAERKRLKVVAIVAARYRDARHRQQSVASIGEGDRLEGRQAQIDVAKAHIGGRQACSCLSGCFSKPQAVVYGLPRPAFSITSRGPRSAPVFSL